MFQFAFGVLLAFVVLRIKHRALWMLIKCSFQGCISFMWVHECGGQIWMPSVIFDLSPTYILGKDLSVSLELTDWLSSNL